jgi:benzodiazapine receptor
MKQRDGFKPSAPALCGELLMLLRINPIVYQTANVVAVIAVLIVNMLSESLPLNDVTTAQVSNSYPNLFTPPGYVFSIWGVIYVLAIVFMIYQGRPSQRNDGYLTRIGFLYFVGALANMCWLLVFHYSYGVPQLLAASLIPMTMLLLCLLSIYQRLGIGKILVPRNQKLAVHLPISVYLGWISLAMIANVASALNALILGIPMPTQALWTAIVIVVALVITALMVWTRRDFAFGLVVIWASIGIALNRIAIPLIFATSIIVAAIAAILIIVAPFLRKKGISDFYMVRSDHWASPRKGFGQSLWEARQKYCPLLPHAGQIHDRL